MPVELMLPSGRKMLVREADPVFLATLGLSVGHVPNENCELSDYQVKQVARCMLAVLHHVMLVPALSTTLSSKTQIHPREISLEDSVFLVMWALKYSHPVVQGEHDGI